MKAKAQVAVTKTDDGKTLTFAAGTQSSLVAAESERVRSGVAPTGKSKSLNKPELKVAEPASTTKGNGRERAPRDVSSSSSSGVNFFGQSKIIDKKYCSESSGDSKNGFPSLKLG